MIISVEGNWKPGLMGVWRRGDPQVGRLMTPTTPTRGALGPLWTVNGQRCAISTQVRSHNAEALPSPGAGERPGLEALRSWSRYGRDD